MIKYGLRETKTGKVLGYYTTSNSDGDFCIDTAYTLCSSEDNMWLVNSRFLAAYVRKNSTAWYNAGYDTPMHDYNPKELEVVKVKQEIEIHKVRVQLPSVKRLFKDKYEKSEPKHYQYIMSLVEKGELDQYDWYDLQNFLYKKGIK